MDELDDFSIGEIMDGLDNFLTSGVKRVTKESTVQVPIRVLARDGRIYEASSYPLDQSVRYVFHSRAGGFVPPEAGADSAFSQLHYGEGAFEGMRVYDSPFGVVMTMPSRNYARLLNSSTVFNPVLARMLVQEFERQGDLQRVELPVSLTPRSFYDLAEQHFQDGSEMTFPVNFVYGNGSSSEVKASLAIQVAFERGRICTLGMKELDTILKVLTFTSGLVSVDHFPPELTMMEAGYFRPWVWVSGELGLKIPSIIVENTPNGREIRNKPLYFAAASLPWSLYLTQIHYDTGLDVLVSPYPRIGNDMQPDSKIAGHYINSLLAINLGAMLGFGEILALNNQGKVTEGSAENLFVIMQEGERFVACTPQTGSGCLPGTVRDGMIRALEMAGMEVRYQALELDEIYCAKAIILTGTGAQIIHVRSFSELAAAEKIADAVRLRSEDESGRNMGLGRDDFRSEPKLVNYGKRHPVVDRIKAAYKQLFLERPQMLQPVFNIDFVAFSKLVGVDLKDFTQPSDRDNIHSGYFKVQGLRDQEEIQARYRAVARMLKTALEKAPKPGTVSRNACRKIY